MPLQLLDSKLIWPVKCSLGWTLTTRSSQTLSPFIKPTMAKVFRLNASSVKGSWNWRLEAAYHKVRADELRYPLHGFGPNTCGLEFPAPSPDTSCAAGLDPHQEFAPNLDPLHPVHGDEVVMVDHVLWREVLVPDQAHSIKEIARGWPFAALHDVSLKPALGLPLRLTSVADDHA